MPQNYTEIPQTQSLQSSLALILSNDKTALSNSAGTVFPTQNLHVGMPCYRTDLQKLYILKDLTPTWILLFDLTGANAVAPQSSNVLGWTPVRQGGGLGQLLSSLFIGWDGAGSLLLQVDSTNYGSRWPISISGDAATVDGLSAGNEAGNVAVNNGELNVNLNADKVDGKDAGNGAGNVAVNNGVVNTTLNADMVDGFHAASFVRSIDGVSPDGSGNVAIGMSAKADRNSANTTASLTGSLNAYAASFPNLTPVPGTKISVMNGIGTNTGATTLSVNGSGGVAVQLWSGTGLRGLNAGEFPTGGVLNLTFTGSVWILNSDTQAARYATSGLAKWGDSIGMAGLHGGGYIDFSGTANGGIVGSGNQGARLNYDHLGRITSAYTANCNCNCDCNCG